MELSSYFASYFGWIIPHDYFIGGLFFALVFMIFTQLSAAIVETIQSFNSRKRREKICRLHLDGCASEPCHLWDCPASKYCSYHETLTFGERLLWAFGVKKKKP